MLYDDLGRDADLGLGLGLGFEELDFGFDLDADLGFGFDFGLGLVAPERRMPWSINSLQDARSRLSS